MNKNTIVAFAAAASAFANASLAFAQEMSGEVATGTIKAPETPETPSEETKSSGRGRGRAAAAEKEEPAKSSGPTLEDLKALIEPLVKGGQGSEVKSAIAKYTDGKLADMDAKHYAAFLKDIEALSI
jgi:hypothetical protein